MENGKRRHGNFIKRGYSNGQQTYKKFNIISDQGNAHQNHSVKPLYTYQNGPS